MPVYGTNPAPIAIYPGDQAFIIGSLATPQTAISAATGEAQGTGAAATNALSERVMLAGPYDRYTLNNIDIQMWFSVNPGTFEYDVMLSDVDAAQQFIQTGTTKISTAAVSPVPGSSLYIAQLSVLNVTARLLALFCKTQPSNACNSFALISR